MRIMPVAVGALSVFLGMGIVYVFNKPVSKKHAPPAAIAPETLTEVAPRSARTSLATRADPARDAARMTKTALPDGVDARWAELNGAGVTALERGQLMKAVELFEQCRAAVPAEPVFTSNLAEALARLSASEFDADVVDRRERAIEHMTRAVELAPAREDLKTRLEQMKRLASSEAGMWTDETEHFQLSYDGERSDLLGGASVVTQALESAYQQYGELFDLYPVESGHAKIRVVLYRRDGFHDATGMGHWAGGVFDGTVRVPVDDLKREKGALTRVLRHELAHAFVRASGGANVPGWLNEGLAQRLEFDSMSHAQSALESARRELSGSELVPFSALQKTLGEVGDETRIAQAYRESLAFVGWLESNYGDRVPFRAVAGGRADGIAAAFERAAGVKLEVAWADFVAGL